LDFVALDQSRAAMAADVEEDVRGALRIAGDQQRASSRIVRHCHSGVGQQRRRAEDLRQAIIDRRLLALPIGGVGIDLGRNGRCAHGIALAAVRNIAGKRDHAIGWPARGMFGVDSAHWAVPLALSRS
jgi:hypothetical protein